MLDACGARLNWILLRGEEIVSVFGLARRWTRVHASVYVWTRLEEIHAFFSVVDLDLEVASRRPEPKFYRPYRCVLNVQTTSEIPFPCKPVGEGCLDGPEQRNCDGMNVHFDALWKRRLGRKRSSWTCAI